MANWEGLREDKSLTQTPSLPLTAWRTGDFSGLRDASGNLIPIYDPATRVFDAAGNVLQAPTPFPGNIVPAESNSPRLATAAGLLPAAIAGGDRRQLREQRSAASQCRPVHVPTRLHAWFETWTFRHSLSHEHGYDPFAIPNMGINTDTDVHQIVFSNTRTIGSNKLNDARIGFGYLKNGHISPRANNENVVKALGINLPSDNPLYWGVPNINVTGLSGPR